MRVKCQRLVSYRKFVTVPSYVTRQGYPSDKVTSGTEGDRFLKQEGDYVTYITMEIDALRLASVVAYLRFWRRPQCHNLLTRNYAYQVVPLWATPQELSLDTVKRARV